MHLHPSFLIAKLWYQSSPLKSTDGVMKRIIITIDGWSSCGKSTLARQLAKALNYVYIDSGAMYRAITLYFLRNHVDWSKKKAVDEALQNINLEFRFNK